MVEEPYFCGPKFLSLRKSYYWSYTMHTN